MDEKIGEQFIEGRIVSLDKEPIDRLEVLLKEVSEKEETIKYDLNGIMSRLIGD